MYIFKNAVRCINELRSHARFPTIPTSYSLTSLPAILTEKRKKEIKDIFRELANQGKCVILVSHSPDVADMCDEKYKLVKISGKKKANKK